MMGFDGWLTTRLTRHRAHREAAKFAASVKVGRTYYSIEECVQPWGDEPMYREWVFTRKRKLSGDPKCGHMTAHYAWLTYGPLFEEKPRGLRALFEKSDGEAPDPKKVLEIVERQLKRQGVRT